MSRFNAKKLGFFAAGITVALLVAQGCSSGDDSQAAPPSAGAGGGHAGSAGDWNHPGYVGGYLLDCLNGEVE